MIFNEEYSKKFYSEFAMLLKQSMFAGKDKLLLK